MKIIQYFKGKIMLEILKMKKSLEYVSGVDKIC
jgi:hypothetical protein